MTSITVHNQTEQDAEYQVTPSPPPPDDEVEYPWKDLPAGATDTVEHSLPALVQFRLKDGSLPYHPGAALTDVAAKEYHADLSQIGSFYVAAIS